MTEPKKTGKKAGRKGGRVRMNITLGVGTNAVAEFIGKHAFGNKSSYLEHLVMTDLERQKLTIVDIMNLAEEWRKKHRPTSASPSES